MFRCDHLASWRKVLQRTFMKRGFMWVVLSYLFELYWSFCNVVQQYTSSYYALPLFILDYLLRIFMQNQKHSGQGLNYSCMNMHFVFTMWCSYYAAPEQQYMDFLLREICNENTYLGSTKGKSGQILVTNLVFLSVLHIYILAVTQLNQLMVKLGQWSLVWLFQTG